MFGRMGKLYYENHSVPQFQSQTLSGELRGVGNWHRLR